ncbi:flagellar hook assembly protein FlgD [Emcibacter sp.]|uniref:flagellar hook assembly protein FlgD n=1 Tax=Emcibacter sp. TaxID=1979954 RepID=UPI003A8FE2AB
MSEVGSATSTPSVAQNASDKLASDFDDFLALLTTQLQYQDPLDPMDSNEFTQQLVSFTGVEQQIAANKNLETLISQMSSESVSNAVNSYLGKEITVETDKAGLNDGKLKWEYTVDSTAETTKITITSDKTGEVVYQGYGETEMGLHQFEWNAPDDLEDGIYTLSVQPATAEGTAIATNIYSVGKVTSIETINGLPYLASNGIILAPDQVLAVKEIPSSDTTDDNTGGDTPPEET